jgi:hypothetical protein
MAGKHFASLIGGRLPIVGDLLKTLDQMVNDQFDSPEFKSFFSVSLTLEGARFYVIQNALYMSNRRDCWAYVKGGGNRTWRCSAPENRARLRPTIYRLSKVGVRRYPDTCGITRK